MQHADNLDATIDRPVEDQVVLKSANLPRSQIGKFPSLELLPLAEFRHGSQPLETGYRSMKESDGRLPILLADE